MRAADWGDSFRSRSEKRPGAATKRTLNRLNKAMPHVRLPTFDRRAFLSGAARGAKLLAAGGVVSAVPLLMLAAQSRVTTPTGEPLASPPEIRSRDGILETTLTAAAGPVRLGEHQFSGFLYNGAFLPPLLRAQRGDTLRIAFRNDLPGKPSNLHYHGMSVSPRGNSDNVFVHVHPGETFQYEVRIPAAGRQGPGLYWYHPHAHGYVDDQILGGMSGALVVDGFERLYPLLKELPERFLFIKHAQIGGGEVVSINGQINPSIAMRPGEMQFWRIAHIGASLFLKFRIEGMALMSSERMAIRCRSRAKCRSSSSVRASRSRRSPSVRRRANTPCARFPSRTKPGARRKRCAIWR
jgi:suppressor of ftsI